MQLPPTVLSLGKHERKSKLPSSSEEQRKNGSESKEETTTFSDPDKGRTSLTDDGEVTDSNSESESVRGDVVIAEEDTTTLAVDTPENPSGPSKRKSSGLRPPRTLETTLFDRLERMYGRGIKRLLNVQYRYVLTVLCPF